jgi:hypothetical protein
VTDHKTQVQCKSCPWRVDCEPDKDIPNYSLDLAKGLTKTIREGTDSLMDYMSGRVPSMACHYSKPDEELPCAGWLYNQLGVGNNIAVRLGIMAGRYPVPEVVGDQHERYEDTLPKRKRGRR